MKRHSNNNFQNVIITHKNIEHKYFNVRMHYQINSIRGGGWTTQVKFDVVGSMILIICRQSDRQNSSFVRKIIEDNSCTETKRIEHAGEKE